MSYTRTNYPAKIADLQLSVVMALGAVEKWDTLANPDKVSQKRLTLKLQIQALERQLRDLDHEESIADEQLKKAKLVLDEKRHYLAITKMKKEMSSMSQTKQLDYLSNLLADNQHLTCGEFLNIYATLLEVDHED